MHWILLDKALLDRQLEVQLFAPLCFAQNHLSTMDFPRLLHMFCTADFLGADVGDKRLISDGFKSAARRFSIDDVTKVLNFVAAIEHWCAPHARWVSTVAASLECGVQVAGWGFGACSSSTRS